jgi:hypothetical protein
MWTMNEEVTMTEGTKATVEVMIRDVVYDAALARAKSQAQQLRGVAREILFDRAALVEPAMNAPNPAGRVLGQPPRTRLRFRANAASYGVARDRLRAAGTSVTAAIEDGLEQYARTGEFK